MKAIHWTWPLLLISPLLVAQPVESESPEKDIVAVVSATPLPDSESVPGLLTFITTNGQSARRDFPVCHESV